MIVVEHRKNTSSEEYSCFSSSLMHEQTQVKRKTCGSFNIFETLEITIYQILETVKTFSCWTASGVKMKFHSLKSRWRPNMVVVVW